jgi:hypothetical protein
MHALHVCSTRCVGTMTAGRCSGRIAAVKVTLKFNPALPNDRPHPLVQGMTIRHRVLSILAHSDDDDAIGRACAVVEKA